MEGEKGEKCFSLVGTAINCFGISKSGIWWYEQRRWVLVG